MGKTLLETIQTNLQAPAQVAPQLGKTEQIQGLLRAKSGKAGAVSSGPKQSSIKEQMAGQTARLGGQQVQQQGQMKAAQLGQQSADIQQRVEQQEQTFEQKRNNMQDQFDRNTFNILDSFEQGQRSLDSSRDVAKLEQAGFLIRLRNDQYVTKLRQEGDKLRFDNQNEYQMNVSKDAMQEQASLFTDELAFKRISDMTAREFAVEIADIDINYAIQVAENSLKAEQSRQVAQGIGSVGTAAVSAAGNLFSSTPAEKTTLDTGYIEGQGPSGSSTFGGPR